MAWKGVIPPREFYHDPSFATSSGFTVAMYLAINKIVPPI